MLCKLYSNDGPLMGEGTCETADNGAIRMVSQQWHLTPQVGGRPLALITEDGTEHIVRVDDVHIAKSGPDARHVEVYQFTPLKGDHIDEMDGGLLDRVKAMWRGDRASSF